MACVAAMTEGAAKSAEDGCMSRSEEDEEELPFDDDADLGQPLKRLREEDLQDSWVDGLLRYRFQGRLWLYSDPRGRLVRGTGTSMWSAGEVLSAYMAERPELYRGATCLELGAGLGGVGLTLAACGAARVLLTDVARQLPLLQRNAQENFPGGEVQARALDWRVPGDRVGLAPWDDCRWSVIVGSDIGYDPELLEPLLETLASQCAPETHVYFALADREEEEEPNVADFVQAASSRFDCEEVYARQLERFQSVTKVLLLRPRASVLAPN